MALGQIGISAAGKLKHAAARVAVGDGGGRRAGGQFGSGGKGGGQGAGGQQGGGQRPKKRVTLAGHHFVSSFGTSG